MKVIVESGATKSEWRVTCSEERFFLPGMNVSAMPMDAVKNILEEGLSRFDASSIEGIYLYVAGVVTQPIREDITAFIKKSMPSAEVDIQNDLIGACRAAWGHGSGLVAILGTGSNSGLFDGCELDQKILSGGYILGDDGSGSVLGRMFITDWLKFAVPEDVAEDFNAEFDSSYETIIYNVYKSDAPARYLGSMAPLILRHYDSSEYIRNLVDLNFRRFVEDSLMKYDVATYPVAVIGGFGYAAREIVTRIFSEYGIRISMFLPAPIEKLVEYHK